MKKEPAIRSLALLCAIWTVLATPAAYCRGASNRSPTTSTPLGLSYRSSSEPFWTEQSRLTFGFQFGYGLENHIPHDLSHINMLIAQPQVGLIVWNSPHSRLPIKRFELISEGILGGSTHPGGELLGNSLFFRFGLMPVGKFVPFVDAGSGPLHTTINSKASEITGDTQFLSQGGVGLQYFFAPQQALVFEYRYFHMSNAGLQPPNPGFNGSMVTIGFTWLHRSRLPAMATSHRGRFHIPRFW